MQRIPAAQSVPRAPAKPSGLRVRVRCNRQGLPPDHPRRVKPCGRRRGSSICLTALAPPVHSANDSGGWFRERSCGRQTGNSGVNPGRPRRCDQATRSAASGHCGAAIRRGLARRHAADEVWKSEDLPGVMGLSDREGGTADTVPRHAREAWSGRSFVSLSTESGFVMPCGTGPFRGRCAPRPHVRAWPPDIHPHADIEPACRWWNCSS